MGSSCFVGKSFTIFFCWKDVKGLSGSGSQRYGIGWDGMLWDGNSVRWMITVYVQSSTPSFNFRIKLGYYPGPTHSPARSLFAVYFATLVLRGNFEKEEGWSPPRKNSNHNLYTPTSRVLPLTTPCHSHYQFHPPSIDTTPSLKLKWPSCEDAAVAAADDDENGDFFSGALQTLTPDIALIHSPIQFPLFRQLLLTFYYCIFQNYLHLYLDTH